MCAPVDAWSQMLAEKNIELAITDPAKDKLADEGYDPVFGARSLKRLLQKDVYDTLSMKMLEGEFREDDRIVIDYRNGGLVFEKGVKGAEAKKEKGAVRRAKV